MRDLGQLQQLGKRRRRPQCASAAELVRKVRIGQFAPRFRHECLARDLAHGGQHPVIGDVAGAQLVVHHLAAESSEIGHGLLPR